MYRRLSKDSLSHNLVAQRIATKLAMDLPHKFTLAMNKKLAQGEEDYSKPTRMVSIRELKELHEARQAAAKAGFTEHRLTSSTIAKPPTSDAKHQTSSIAKGPTSDAKHQTSSIAKRPTSIAEHQTIDGDSKSATSSESFPVSIAVPGEHDVKAPLSKRLKGSTAEC